MSDNRNSPISPLRSRRSLLQSGLALGAGLAVRQSIAQQKPPVLAYVGSYNTFGGPGAHGEGITLFRMDPPTGTLSKVKTFPDVKDPSWLAIHPNKTYMYAASESHTPTDTVTAFSVNPVSGNLSVLNVVSARGIAPVYLSFHPSGKFLFAADYASADIVVFPILTNGSLGDPVDAKKTADVCVPAPCHVGPPRAEKGPPGSTPPANHLVPHAHMIASDPAGKYVLVNDIALDLTIVWKFDAATGKLSDPKTVPASPGAGPRHFVFHPNGRFVYSVNEEACSIALMIYDAATGTLTPKGEVSTVPAGFTGTSLAAEIAFSKDARTAYVSNRIHESIAIFDIAADGTPALTGEVPTGGSFARHISLDPTGSYLYACNQGSDSITAFRIESGGRSLKLTGTTPAGSPTVIVFL